MTARAGVDAELRRSLRDRRKVKAKLEDIAEQRVELLVYPKVARYLTLHADEQATRDELTQIETRIVELAELQEEVP